VEESKNSVTDLVGYFILVGGCHRQGRDEVRGYGYIG
jgi:hypothetical protein